MNLQSILHLLDLNRNTYNTIERRTGLPFMKRELMETSGHDRYNMVHALALACMLEFQTTGLELNRACRAVDEFLGVIDGLLFDIESHLVDPSGAWLTVINFSDGGWGWASGREAADTFGGGDIASKVSINVVPIWRKMGERIVLPMANDPESVA